MLMSGFLAVLGGVHRKADLFQLLLDQLAVHRVVFHQQHAPAGLAGRRHWRGRGGRRAAVHAFAGPQCLKHGLAGIAADLDAGATCFRAERALRMGVHGARVALHQLQLFLIAPRAVVAHAQQRVAALVAVLRPVEQCARSPVGPAAAAWAVAATPVPASAAAG
ncbi:hypothetical protein G6F50_015450 [Rhizopus delemar]|uniref:Uncharacterized protein n=1 Tax=Rhizopus delemar TaxID=936053 RepID=A0A9P6XYB9_9FUNG|nr:hypothetical protein G6F50_015450 [Rhizopus delemar]